MPTLNQLLKKRRKKKIHKNHLKALEGCPQKKGICVRIFTTKPKKPNSAIRKVARVRLRSSGKLITCAIIGQGHNLYQHCTVLVRGGRIKDVPGVRYKLIKGVYDFRWKESKMRKQSRSFYGTPKNQEKFIYI